MCAHGALRAQVGEKHAMKNAMIRYLLNAALKKTPIKSIDIVKQCLNNEQKWFPILLPEVEEALADVYGLTIHEIKEKPAKFYLITSEFASGSVDEWPESEREELRLLFIVLSYIFMKGGEVLEPTLFGFLRKLEIEDEPHEYFGFFKKKITETFIKQHYLRKEKTEMEAGNVEERFQYSWGHRAELEFKKKDVLNLVAQLMKRPAESFATQYAQCDSENEEMEMDL